jgi:hypothetical protein
MAPLVLLGGFGGASILPALVGRSVTANGGSAIPISLGTIAFAGLVLTAVLILASRPMSGNTATAPEL